MRKFFVTAAAVMALTAGVALAAEPQARQIPGIGKVPHQVLFEALSEEGETMDQFALRIAPKLREFSDETGYEACGMLAEGGGRMGVVVGTNFSHLACANFHSLVPAGMKSTGENIHSHGGARSFSASRADKLFMAAAMREGNGQPVPLKNMVSVHGQDLHAFSNVDFASGPGYLATPEGVIHQNGNRVVRKVEGRPDRAIAAAP